jgi:hypothetical protein
MTACFVLFMFSPGDVPRLSGDEREALAPAWAYLRFKRCKFGIAEG